MGFVKWLWVIDDREKGMLEALDRPGLGNGAVGLLIARESQMRHTKGGSLGHGVIYRVHCNCEALDKNHGFS